MAELKTSSGAVGGKKLVISSESQPIPGLACFSLDCSRAGWMLFTSNQASNQPEASLPTSLFTTLVA
jgi:hypothetical protein